MDLGLVFGKNWGHRIIIFLTILIYGYLFLKNPNEAKKGLSSGLKTFISLFTLIVAALLLSSAIEVLLPVSLVQEYLGVEAGVKGSITGGLIGGILQGGPFAAYPIIRTLNKEGASIAAVISMIIGYNAIGTGRIPYGLAFFDPEIVGIRIIAGTLLTILAAIGLYLIFG
ncbi:MAG: putative permease [Candidatus Methanohalarchaeum thermophilum]|uniref:Permease n=1 Tax=Methanohalarchaeum thermophilum TaxID=1903181 RepID=A0A1Q6DU14_METT1|nr:MAG: putative permease [Candidatus Methanohalarchaeum thermophilum]